MRDRQHLAVDAGREDGKSCELTGIPRDIVPRMQAVGRQGTRSFSQPRPSATGMPRCQTVCCGNGISIPSKVECGFDAPAQLGLIRNCSDGGLEHKPDRDAARAEALEAPDLGLLDGGLQVSGDSPRDGTRPGRRMDVATLTSSPGTSSGAA
jgi:hypothetical protein